MMKCREYVFLVSSKAMNEATLRERMNAFAHRMICDKCRAFTRNDQQLDVWLRQFRESLQAADDAKNE